MSDPHPPPTAVREAVARALSEDLGALGDLTTGLLPPEAKGRAAFVARAEGVVAGRLCVEETYAQLAPSVQLRWTVEDGAEVGQGEVIATVSGPLAAILTGERTALNFLCHLSGIATLTRRYVRAVRGRAQIRDTRKTTPGLRALEKAAVRAGGGANHRGSLSEHVLVKDNHLSGLSIADAVRRARLAWPGRIVEVECDDLDQVRQSLEAKADLVLLDNMTAPMVKEAVALIDGACLVEASGGVTLATVGDLAEAGADFISVGALTHSVPILDIGLDVEG